jgi:hypothetical protein
MHDHLLHLLFARCAASYQRSLDERMRERLHRYAVFATRQAQDAPCMAHEHGRRGIFVAGPQLFDDHALRLQAAHDVGHRGVQFGKARFEGAMRIRRDHACFHEAYPAVLRVDDAVSGRSQTRIDAENSSVLAH